MGIMLTLTGLAVILAGNLPASSAESHRDAEAGPQVQACVEDDGANPACDDNSSVKHESDSVRYAREYRECVIATAVRMGRGNLESAAVVARAARARCEIGEEGNRLFLMRTASETEALRRSAAMFRSGVRGTSAAQIKIDEEMSYRRFLDYVDGQAIAAVLDARAE